MSTQPNNPTKAAAATKAAAPKAAQNRAGATETAPRINAAAAAATFNPSAKLRRAINANNTKATKVGRQNLGVIVDASLLIHEVSQEVNRANKGTRKGQPTYVNKEAAILSLFGVSKSDLSRIYNKIANAALETYGGKAEALMGAYEAQRGASRPSVSSLLAFLKGDEGKGKAKQAPRRFSVNLETGKVSAPEDITPAEVKSIVEALKALTK